MSNLVSVSLDSYRLGCSPGAALHCHVCQAGNVPHADVCCDCFAPMALTHQALKQKTEPFPLAALGAVGAGKTVYLGMLMDMLSRQQSGLQMLVRGAFSINMQQTAARALARCEFPPKTPNEPDRWNWVHCQIRRPKNRRPSEIIIPDPAGEAILEELDHPNSYPGIKAVLARCRGAILLLDTLDLEGGSRDQEYFAMKVLSYLSELPTTNKKGWDKRPVALLFTKADRCDTCFEDPAGYAQRRLPGVWRHCQERFGRHRFFACGVAGGFGYRVIGREAPVQVPLRIEPRGIIEPFEWLMRHVHK
jgi:hypothetical protein